MNKQELLQKLEECAENGDTQGAHIEADKALLEFIDDEEITEAFRSWRKWYA